LCICFSSTYDISSTYEKKHAVFVFLNLTYFT
jgi:hypothetical protein